MSDVFISYVEEDGRIANEIAQGLQVAGYSTWHYERDGLPGTDYLETIGATIDAVKAVVIVISAKSLQSQQVYHELVRAAENNKALFPLLYGITHEQFQRARPEMAPGPGRDDLDRHSVGRGGGDHAATAGRSDAEGDRAIGRWWQPTAPTAPTAPTSATPAAHRSDLGLRRLAGARDRRKRGDHAGGDARRSLALRADRP